MGISFKGVIKGTVFSVIITFSIILILAVLSYFTKISESVIITGVYAAVIAGVLMGTIAVSKAASGKAFLHAMLVCLMYLMCLAGVSAAINGTLKFNTHFLAICAGIFGAGILGCIIGK